MKASDLRIGNWVYIRHSSGNKSMIQMRSFFELCNIESSPEDYEPIPLTEEWLLKFGFEKFIGNNILWGLADFCVGWYGNKFATWIIRMQQENNEMNFHSQIKYVHQLQNLYFALTGEELIVSSNRD